MRTNAFRKDEVAGPRSGAGLALADAGPNARPSAVARVSEAPPEISRGAPHTLLAYYYELQ